MYKLAIMISALVLLAACAQTAPVDPVPAQPDVECILPADCDGKPHAACVGEWVCINAECSFECEQVEEPEPAPEPEPTPEPEPEPEVSGFDEIEVSQAAYDYVVGEADTKFSVLSPNFKLVDAGEGFAAALAVKNNEHTENLFQVFVTYDGAYNEGNQPIFMDAEDMQDWIQADSNASIGPGGMHVFTVKVLTPEDAVPGSYEFAVEAQRRDHGWDNYYGEHTITVKVK